MMIGILAAVLGALFGTAAIVIPQLIRRRYQQPENDDVSRAYLKATGRSAEDIARGNADQAGG